MQCVRCLKDTASKIADAPDGSGAWELYHCERCHYSWHSDEPSYITNIEERDPWGQIPDDPNFQGTKMIAESDYKSTHSKKK